MAFTDNVLIVLSAAKLRLFHDIYHKLSLMGAPFLTEGDIKAMVRGRSFSGQERDIRYDALLNNDLFDVAEGRLTLTPLAVQIGGLCEEYNLWEKGISIGRPLPESYYKMLTRVGMSEFDMDSIPGYRRGPGRRIIDGFASRKWLKAGGPPHKFNLLCLKFLEVIARVWAGTRSEEVYPSKETLLVLADSLHEVISKKGLVPKIKKLDAALDNGPSERKRRALEAELAKHAREWKQRLKGVPADEREGLEHAVFGHSITLM